MPETSGIADGMLHHAVRPPPVQRWPVSNRNNQRSIGSRFGDACEMALPDGRRFNVAEVIQSGAPGDGWTPLPTALDVYEAALGLTVPETWLLKRMLAHAWTWRTPVYLSMRKVARQSGVSRACIMRALRGLERKGYILRMPGVRGDRRVRYDVRPLYVRLALEIAQDQQSAWSAEHGGALSTDQAQAVWLAWLASEDDWQDEDEP